MKLKNLVSTCIAGLFCTSAIATTPLPTGYNSFQEIMTRGDISTTKNNLGMIVTKLPANATTEQLFAFGGSTPIIWAKYYEGTSTGQILSTAIQKDIQTNTIVLTTETLTPAMGQRFGNGNGIYIAFKGTNPFAEFIDAGNPNTYKGLNIQAFMSIVGMWAKHKTASKGLIVETTHEYDGNYNWSTCGNNTRSSNANSNINFCTSKDFHNEAVANVKPNWYIMAPAEVGEGHSIMPTYTATPCLSAGGTLKECQVRGGFSFIKATNGSDFPITAQKMWHYHEQASGDTGAMIEFLTTANIIRDPSSYNGALIGNAASKITSTHDYTAGYGNNAVVLNGHQADASRGPWSPVDCFADNTRGSAAGTATGGRYGLYECNTTDSSAMPSMPAGIGTFYQSKVLDPAFDYSITNDTETLRSMTPAPDAFKIQGRY